MNREIKTNLYNILDLINCAETYGYGDDVFYHAMFTIINPVSDFEIESYSNIFMTEEMLEKGYGEADKISTINNLTELNNKYGK